MHDFGEFGGLEYFQARDEKGFLSKRVDSIKLTFCSFYASSNSSITLLYPSVKRQPSKVL